MSLETYINQYRPTLNGDITSSATSLVLSTVFALPTKGNCRILINTELIQITLNGTTTVTAIRGIEGTTAASHTNTTLVYFVLTAGALNQTRAEFFNFGVFSSRDLNGNIGRWYRDSDGNTMAHDDGTNWNNFGWCPVEVTPPVISSMTKLGFAGASATNANIFAKSLGAATFIYDSAAISSANQIGAFVQAVNASHAVGWTAIVGVEVNFSALGIMAACICLYESSSGKISIFGPQNSQGNFNYVLSNYTISNASATTATTSFSSYIAFPPGSAAQPDFKFYMFKYVPGTSTTSIMLFESIEGINWVFIATYSFSSMNSMTFPTHVGVAASNNTTFNYNSTQPGFTWFHNSYTEP